LPHKISIHQFDIIMCWMMEMIEIKLYLKDNKIAFALNL